MQNCAIVIFLWPSVCWVYSGPAANISHKEGDLNIYVFFFFYMNQMLANQRVKVKWKENMR